MECQAIQAQLSAWLDDELDAAAGAVLTAHLNGCEACRREWRELTALDAALSNLAAVAPSARYQIELGELTLVSE